MSYNRKNKLLFMKDVLDLYLQEKKPGVSTTYVYRTFIYPRYRISMTTLYKYLSTPVTKLLKEDEKKAGGKSQ